MRDRIKKTVNSVFRPLFDACENSSSSVTESSSNNFDDSQRYIAFIRDYRINAMNQSSAQSVDVVVNGTWNFKLINAEYENEEPVVDGLRIENVTGIIKLWNGPKELVTFNYNADYFLLTINHAHSNIRVKIPECFKCFAVVNTSNTSFIPDIAEIRGTIERTVAPFIEQSIYGKYFPIISSFRIQVHVVYCLPKFILQIYVFICPSNLHHKKLIDICTFRNPG